MHEYFKVIAKFRGETFKVVIRKGKLTYAAVDDYLYETPTMRLTEQEWHLHNGRFSSYENAVIISLLATQHLKLVEPEVQSW